jgi:hypothetical protein
MRVELLRRLEKLESALAARAPRERALIWRCAGDAITAADRRAAANAAGERGTPRARVVFVTITDASLGRARVEQAQPVPPRLTAAQHAVLDVEFVAGRITARQSERLASAFAGGVSLRDAVERGLNTDARTDARVAYLADQLHRAGGPPAATPPQLRLK